MKRVTEDFFREEKIEYFSSTEYKSAHVLREDIISRENFTPKSIIVFLIPYYASETKNISLYASPRDYHLYIKELEVRFERKLSEYGKSCRFRFYSDHSPIDERHLAAALNLGIIGKNRLLINEKYGSFVFIGEIITDIEPAELSAKEIGEVAFCENCGACTDVCPTKSLTEKNECLSAITQKKGELSPFEAELICKYGVAWGCDACQRVCPHNQSPRITPIPFFLENRIDELTTELLSGMSEQEFSERAFSWRGRKTVGRNLELLENHLK